MADSYIIRKTNLLDFTSILPDNGKNDVSWEENEA